MENLNDRQLLKRCRDYGRRSLKWRWKFLGLLPEVDRRRLWDNGEFFSVFHFAAQTAGVSREQVRRILNMDKRFEENRVFGLREMLVEGEISPNKLARVVSVANPDTEEEWVAQLKVLPQRAVERLVEDIRFNKPKIEVKSVHVHLDPDVEEALLKISNVNDFLREALQQRAELIECKKEQIALSLPNEQSRFIPAQVERVINEEWGSKCAVRSCAWIANEVHHLVPFSINPVHDPRLMAPLCREHHAVAHSVNRCVQRWKREALRVKKTHPLPKVRL